jgi:hypothetical protein
LTKRKKRRFQADKAEYQVTDAENAALSDHLARIKTAPRAPRIKLTTDGRVCKFRPDHPDTLVGIRLLMEALGTADYSFGIGLISQLINAGSRGSDNDENDVNFMLSVVKGIKPRDHLEAMLAAQMAAIHMATMTFARQLAHVENIPQQDSAERALNKLARTYAAQMEALKRYRTGGEQKVTVQHVSVSEGGQAIVGNVTQANPKNADEKAAASSPRALTHEKASPMPIIDEKKKRPALIPVRRARQEK